MLYIPGPTQSFQHALFLSRRGSVTYFHPHCTLHLFSNKWTTSIPAVNLMVLRYPELLVIWAFGTRMVTGRTRAFLDFPCSYKASIAILKPRRGGSRAKTTGMRWKPGCQQLEALTKLSSTDVGPRQKSFADESCDPLDTGATTAAESDGLEWMPNLPSNLKSMFPGVVSGRPTVFPTTGLPYHDGPRLRDR